MGVLEFEIVHHQQIAKPSTFARINMKLQGPLLHRMMGLCRTLPHRLLLALYHQATLAHQQATQLLGESNRPYLWKAFYCILHFLFSFAFLLNFESIPQMNSGHIIHVSQGIVNAWWTRGYDMNTAVGIFEIKYFIVFQLCVAFPCNPVTGCVMWSVQSNPLWYLSVKAGIGVPGVCFSQKGLL